MLLLVHHGEALPPDIDAQRPLTPRGREDAAALAAEVASRGVKPDVVWHSGKLRARQTAEAFWRACNPLAEFAAVRGLQPTDPAEWMADRVAGDSRTIICVGHLPNLPRLLRRLVGGDDDAPLNLPPNGVVALVSVDGQRWVEQWRLDPRAPGATTG